VTLSQPVQITTVVGVVKILATVRSGFRAYVSIYNTIQYNIVRKYDYD